ncbi:alpha/beta hydrolase [Nocardioides sp. AX2bis]|uniref:alpha/beta hydrolase n=1 Tax=Nocardioides sp. AX2bis TaxID=2653157 RepID=UPI0012EF5DB5|nr:alpha/beta fold hydrolase [Nocardioides sp. AX2bis]VXB84431.1 Alpha/beta hydrolase [Nocardioides sp. AX2bis]
MPAPSLTRLDPTTPPRAVVLLLHGGKPHGRDEVGARSASWRRMAALQRAVTPRLHGAGAASWLLRYRERGWNGTGASATQDARWALDQVRDELGDVPVVLLGHSMGARTAVHVADHDSVDGVVALAPWWDRSDPVSTLRGRHLRAAHGRADRITSARMTRDYVRRAGPVASSTGFEDMGRVGHYMLRRVERWEEVATASCLALLGDRTTG